MRIDCESCGAAYAIDDSLIGDRGVRAQCPRCGAQKVVKKPAAADFGGAPAAPAADPFAQTVAPQAGPFGGAPPSPFGASKSSASNPFAGAGPFASGPAPNPFAGAPPNSPFGAPPAAPSGPTNPFMPAAPAPFASGAPNPFGGAGQDPFAAPVAAPNPFAPPPAAPLNPFAAPATAPPNPFAPAPAASPFSGPPADPFAALGQRPPDPFARQPTGAGGGPAAEPAPLQTQGEEGRGGLRTADGKDWVVKGAGKEWSELTLDDVRNKIKAGEITRDAQASQEGGPFRPITAFAALAVSFKSESKPRKVVYRQSGGGVGPLLVVVLILGAGGAAYFFKDKLLASREDDQENIFRRRAQTWKLQFPDLDGTAQDHVRKGMAFFLEDTVLGYRLAHEEFMKALCLDPDNLEAMGAYVENFAALPVRRSDENATRDAVEAIDYAVKKNPRRGSLLRARGALLLKTDHVEEAQASLRQALALDEKDALTRLYLAQSNLERSVPEAVTLAEEALRLEPGLSRANQILGLARQKQGRFKTALNLFRARLAKDPEHQATLLAIARLYVEVGDFQPAQQNLEKLLQLDGRNHQARLMLSKVLYQGLRDFRRAESQLAELAASLGQEGSEIAREVHTHHAFVLGERGKWKEAEDAIGLALRESPEYGPALYVAGRVLLHRGGAAEAAQKLERAAQQVQNSYREAPVRTALADVLRVQGRKPEAIRAYAAVIKSDTRYVRAYLGLASLHAESGNMQQAAAMMREVLDIDPFHRADHFYFTDYPETPRDVEEYRAGWSKLAAEENDASIVLSSEGITAFHAEQWDDAERLLKGALKDDRNNLAAEIYLGAVYLQKKRPKDAVTALTSALRINALHVRAAYLMARAYELAGDTEKAEKRFIDIRDSDPNFVAAINAQGQLALAAGQEDRARELFLEAFRSDQDFTPAKRNLLQSNY